MRHYKYEVMTNFLGTRYIVAIAVAIFTFVIFLPSLQNEFINFDDYKYVYDNPYIKSLNSAFFKWAFLGFSGYGTDYWMPVSYLSHAIVYSISGTNPVGHHLANNIIHSVNAFLVVLLALTLLNFVPVSAASQSRAGVAPSVYSLISAVTTGLLFGIHPLRVESVAWIAERKDILAAFFYLLALISYIRYQNDINSVSSRNFMLNRNYLLTAGLFILSLASKPMAVSLPFVMLILDWYPFERIISVRTFRSVLIEKVPLLALSAASSFITMIAQRNSVAISSVADVPFHVRLIAAPETLINYLFKMIAPVNLVPWYSYPESESLFSPEYVISIAFVAAVTALFIILSRRQKLWISVWAYFIMTLLPVLGVIVAIPVSMADRYTYLPCLGPFLIAGLAVAGIHEKLSEMSRQRYVSMLAGSAVATAIVLSMSYATVKQIGIWKNNIVFWNYFVEHTKGQSLSFAHDNLGAAYAELKRYDEAVIEYMKSLRINPSNPVAHNNLGYAYSVQGRADMAINEYLSAIRSRPDYDTAYNNLGNAYVEQGRINEAVNEYKKAINLNPDYYDAHYNLGLAYAKLGFIDLSVSEYLIALKINPDDADIHYNLGQSFLNKGELVLARKEFETVLRITPDDYDAKKMLDSINLK